MTTDSTGGERLPSGARKLLREYLALIEEVLDDAELEGRQLGEELRRIEEIEQQLEARYDVRFEDDYEEDE